MTTTSEILLTLFLLTNLTLAGTGRLPQAIRLVAAQGWFIGILPILLWNWPEAGAPGARVWAVSAINALVKGLVLPMLIMYPVRKVHAKREVEPLVKKLEAVCAGISLEMDDKKAIELGETTLFVLESYRDEIARRRAAYLQRNLTD